jgi:hypothetical protein
MAIVADLLVRTDTGRKIGDEVLSEVLSRLELVTISAPALRLTGLLLPAPAARVRLAVGEQVFEFEVGDIASVSPRDDDRSPTGAVVLDLRSGARLYGVYPASSYRELLRGRRPFALSVRPDQSVPTTGRFAAMERDYLERRGLISAS